MKIKIINGVAYKYSEADVKRFERKFFWKGENFGREDAIKKAINKQLNKKRRITKKTKPFGLKI